MAFFNAFCAILFRGGLGCGGDLVEEVARAGGAGEDGFDGFVFAAGEF